MAKNKSLIDIYTDELQFLIDLKQSVGIHTSATVGLRGPQKNAIELDLRRLSDEPGDLKRYLIVISEDTKNAVERQIKPQERFPSVNVIDAIGLVQSPPGLIDEDE